MKRLLLVLLLLLGACSQGQITWQSEIDQCVQGTGNADACYEVAGWAIHSGCSVGAYRIMAKSYLSQEPLHVNIERARVLGLCPPPQLPRGGAGQIVTQ